MRELERHFEQLTPQERLALTVAALSRGKRRAAEQLEYLAPRLDISVPHHLGHAIAVDVLRLIYVADQLDKVAALWLLDQAPRRIRGAKSARQVVLYTYAINQQAWRAFCQDNLLDPDQVLMPHYKRSPVLKILEELIPLLAPDAKQVVAILNKELGPARAAGGAVATGPALGVRPAQKAREDPAKGTGQNALEPITAKELARQYADLYAEIANSKGFDETPSPPPRRKKRRRAHW